MTANCPPAGYDALVVGGGPAGAATATWLAREGFRVLVIDRADFPRDKACGEFLTPGAVAALQRLGIWEAVLHAGAAPVSGIRLFGPGGGLAEYRPNYGAPAGWSIRRTALDATLLAHARIAGADVLEGTAVSSVRYDVNSRKWSVSLRQIPVIPSPLHPLTLSSSLLIGADGTHSLVARQLGLVRRIPRLERVGLVCHWSGVSGDALEMRARDGAVCGFGPLGVSSANVTLVVPRSESRRIAGRAGSYVEEAVGRLFPDLADRLSSGKRDPEVQKVGCFGHLCRHVSAAGALLVGDAATFVDPFTGEGIYFALRGAELAAKVASTALREGDLSARRLAAYDRSRAELARRYLLCFLVQAAVRNGAVMDRAVAALARARETRNTLMSVLADVDRPDLVLQLPFAGELWHAAIGVR